MGRNLSYINYEALGFCHLLAQGQSFSMNKGAKGEKGGRGEHPPYLKLPATKDQHPGQTFIKVRPNLP